MIGFAKKTPVVLQMEAAECGAASLAMLLAAHGRHITLEEARAACETSRDGIDAGRLVAAAERQGLDVKALRCEVEELDDLPLPAILHWAFDHFVVLESIESRHFVILDPAIGRRNVDRAELGRNFTGLVIAAEPGENFHERAGGDSVIATLTAEALRSRDAMLMVSIATLAAVIPGVAMSGAVGVLVDHIIVAGRSDWSPGLVAILALVAVVTASLAWLRSRIEAGLRAKIGVNVAAQGFWHALHLPLSYFSLRSAGEICGRLRLGADLGGAIAGPLSQLVPNVAMILCYVLVVAFYSPSIALATFLIAGLNIALLGLLAQRVADANRAYQVAEGRATGSSTAGFMAIESYRALGREELLVSRLAASEDKALDAEQRLGRLRALAGIGPAASGLVMNAVVLAIGTMLIMYGELSLGGLIAIQMIAGLLNAPVAALAASLPQLQEAAGALMRVADLNNNDLAPEFAPDLQKREPEKITGRLTLRNVGFGYSSTKQLFSGVDLELPPGRFVALMGGSGTGKSTLARLAAGLVEPTAGEVLLDGVPLVQWPQHSLRRTLLYVPQTSAVFSGSLEENLTMWDETIDSDATRRAVELAGLERVVAGRAGGAMAQLSANKVELSGGEVQRLALARALARSPKLLILDETTGALNSATEEVVLEGLRSTGAAVLIVTHRARTALKCDEAILMGNGGIMLRGKPGNVLAVLEGSAATAEQRRNVA